MRHPEDDQEFCKELCDWLRANDVDPGLVPMSQPDISIEGDRLTYRRAVLSELTQSKMVDPNNPFTLLTEVVSTRLVTRPSPDIAEWLMRPVRR